VDAVGCSAFFSGLISMYVFDILHILSRCIQICSGGTGGGWEIDKKKKKKKTAELSACRT